MMTGVNAGRASKTRSAFRMEYSIAAHINAGRARVWQLMTDAANFSRWNSTVASIAGRIAAGETLQLVAASAPGRVFKLTVDEFVPEKRMVWSDGNIMFKGVRTYTFESRADSSTDFTMSEVYTGLMLPMIAGSLPDFRPIFEQYASDLKQAAEKTG